MVLGLGYELRAPQASASFISPEINNDFVTNLKNERVFSSEIGYQYQNSWIHANVGAYYSHITNSTEWTCFYFDDINSFSYVSLTGIKKDYYGVELGAKFKIASFLDFKLIGTISEAKYKNNARVRYMNSTKATYSDDILISDGLREDGTPLTAAGAILSYHQGGWFVDLNCNYYDRIYLSYSPYYRYKSVEEKLGKIDEQNNPLFIEQDKGHGGYMVDGSIGRSIYLKKGSLSINLMVTNILNNEHLCTGGYEQSRSDVTSSGNSRAYKFSRNPKKYYAYGTNGMLNIAYKF
jgi:outer membrane receptor protein involved in Fe transport